MPQDKEGLLFYETIIQSMTCKAGGKVIKSWKINEANPEERAIFSFRYGNDCNKIYEQGYIGKQIQVYKRTETSMPVEVILGERVIYSVEDTYNKAVDSGYIAASGGLLVYFGYTIPRLRRRKKSDI